MGAGASSWQTRAMNAGQAERDMGPWWWCPTHWKSEKKSCVTELTQDLPLLSTEPGSCLRPEQNCRGYSICSSTPAPSEVWMADVLLFIDTQTHTNLPVSNDSSVLSELINRTWGAFSKQTHFFFFSWVKWDVKWTTNRENWVFFRYTGHTGFSSWNLVTITKQTLSELLQLVWFFSPQKMCLLVSCMEKQVFLKKNLKEHIRNLFWHQR